jgi:4-amino-4-deoxy-L-arabinose transferase-like glycosyltransferase
MKDHQFMVMKQSENVLESDAWFFRPIGQAILLIVLAVCFFIGLGKTEIADKHEAWVAAAGRNMAQSGEWIVPKFNGKLRVQKPPLPAWVTGTMEAWFGPGDETLYRIPPAAMGVLGLFLAMLTGWVLFGRRTGLLAAMMLAVMIEYCYHARHALPDIYLFFWVSLGFWLLSVIFFGAKRRDWLWVVFWLAMGGAWMSKYLVPFAFLLPGMIYGLWAYKDRRPRWYWHGIGIVLFLSIPLGWISGLAWRVGWHGAMGIWKTEFTTDVASKKFFKFDFYKYFFWFFAISFPWSVLAGAGIVQFFRRGGRDETKKNEFRWLAVIFASVFVLFSLGSHKKITYIMPLFPLIAILGARAWLLIARQGADASGRFFRHIGAAQAILLAAAGAGVCVYSYFDPLKRVSLCMAIGASYAMGGLVSLAMQKRNRFPAAFAAMVIGAGLANVLLFNQFIPREDARVAVTGFARQVKDQIKDEPLAFFNCKSEAMVYFLNRDIPNLNDEAALKQFCAEHPTAYILTSPAKLEAAQSIAATVILQHRYNINSSYSFGESDGSKEFLLLRHDMNNNTHQSPSAGSQ